MAITHIVLFKFKADAEPEVVKKNIAAMLALKDNCKHPTTQSTYIKSMSGGVNNSTEGRDNGFTYAFVVEFESPEDRDYYVNVEPAHQAFVQGVLPIVDDVVVVDYTPGVFP